MSDGFPFERRIIHGFPQGSPLSPLLSIACQIPLFGPYVPLGHLAKQGSFTMYADDGLLISEKPDIDITKYFSPTDEQLNGVILAREKPHGLTKKFKFLGVKYDISLENNKKA